MELNRYGKIVYEEWFRTQKIRPYVVLREREFVIMPNHIHGIIWIRENTLGGNLGRTQGHTQGQQGHTQARTQQGRTQFAPTIWVGLISRSLGAIIAGFKSSVTKKINQIQKISLPIWQRNYYEHIIRNKHELKKIQQYIINNPVKWEFDMENPKNLPNKRK